MLHIYRHQIITITALFIIAFCTSSVAQRPTSYNYDNKYKSKNYYFGIRLGYSSFDYNILQSKAFILNENYGQIATVNGPSFDIGVIANFKLGPDVDFRFNPGFSFASRDVVFRKIDQGQTPGTNPEIIVDKIQSNYLTFPISLRYKSQPYRDLRIYILGGFSYAYDLEAKNRRESEKTLLYISPHDYMGEVGVGFQFFFPYFILSPEIKYSHGIDNINIHDRSSNTSSVIEKIKSRVFTITLHFEG